MRHCRVCNQDKEESEFFTKPNGKPRGLTCKDCDRAKNRERWNEGSKTRGRPKGSKAKVTLPQEELDRLRRLHNVQPGRTPHDERANIRPGGEKHPLPDWVKKWIASK